MLAVALQHAFLRQRVFHRNQRNKILFLPMIYTDPRGEKEAEWLLKKFGAEKLFSTTGVLPQSMYSIAKLLWIKKNYSELFEKADKVMLTCDYLGYLLTGERVIDYALASRTGAFNIEKLCFDQEILSECEISTELFSKPKRAGSIVGKLKRELCEEIGIEECMLVLGSHDQVCATLGAGVISAGQAADGMGTVECITVLFDKKPNNLEMGIQGYPCVPFAVEGLYCTYILNLSNGSIVSWYKNKLLHNYIGEESSFFAYVEKNMKDQPTGILVLPYFGGSSTPYQDINAKGAILNLDLQTSDSDLYKGILEGTALEMCLNADIVKEYGIMLDGAVATGGGANSRKWLQIKADIQNIPYKTLRSSEGGLCGCAILQAIGMRQVCDFRHAVEIFVQYGEEFLPNPTRHVAYRNQYEKYKKLYRTLKEFN
ncbi:MAG: FGGY-family carbohydrate kinase [Candidatus Borkfalkiaceae bacterium]|nr:FGGY family carbohydrate kinase [Clostridia bacterium]MDY6223328.1 FGGY-family carbohydrate kinase [Christensenellaceae bacterium]